MPITAKRWLSIIQAATNMRLAKQAARDGMRVKSEAIRRGQLTYEQAWNELTFEIEAIAATSDSDLIIERESWVYNRNYKHNEQERRRQERRRREHGIPLKELQKRSYLGNISQVAAEIEETDIETDDLSLEQAAEQLSPEQRAEIQAAKEAWLAANPEEPESTPTEPKIEERALKYTKI